MSERVFCTWTDQCAMQQDCRVVCMTGVTLALKTPKCGDTTVMLNGGEVWDKMFAKNRSFICDFVSLMLELDIFVFVVFLSSF